MTIPDLPEYVVSRLQQQAASHGRSAEEEARAVLMATYGGRAGKDYKAVVEEVQAFVERLYGDRKPQSAVDELIAERRREAALE